MKCAVVTTTNPDAASAMDGLAERLRDALDGHDPHLVVVFFTPHHGEDAALIRERIVGKLSPEVLLGCPAEGVIGESSELENGAAIALWGAYWPGVELQPFRLGVDGGDGAPHLEGWPEGVPDDAGLLVLVDPYTTPARELLDDFVERFPGRPLVGGMASGVRTAGEAQLLTHEGVFDEGTVGVVIGGAVRLDTVVSQGCRPIGRHYVVTKANENRILALGGKPALEQLRALVEELEPGERRLLQTSLHVGRAVDERKSAFSTGDLVVRNVMGIDPAAQSIAIGDFVRAGQTVQFMVRDAKAASDELAALLAREHDATRPLGALLFSCNGRGNRFFGKPNHDIDGLHGALGDVPTAGFFCAGEIGPIGGTPFLHGFTASIALFRERGA
ncbi:MAG: FIST C-terminal domain-containing protein [Planctomycetes bacterium]|nr:FIST C-terminal domain-containing protein [Planctomycetota bacterium]